jgi:tRNA-Thr(GGU) m(6)t(6)A37 methyltransferase TsaA
MKITYRPIGVIHTPFTETVGMPIQPLGAYKVKGTVEIQPEFAEGLKDLDGFSHIILLYHFHRVKGMSLSITPFLDSQARGLFATRVPRRPNPIGLSIVKLLSVEENVLHVENVDILDGTPLLDIKPYVPMFDQYSDTRVGWLEEVQIQARDHRCL